MHNNYYFLRRLSPALEQRLRGYRVAECFSQNRNELIVGLAGSGKDFYIKAVLNPSFCCLVFPDNFHRSKRNSVDLFPEIIDREILSVRQFENERAFAFTMAEGKTLLFKMHGNRSNVLLFEGNEPVVLFRNNLQGDLALRLDTLDRPIDTSYEAFKASGFKKNKLFPTFGKVVEQYLQEQGYEQADEEKKYELLIKTDNRLREVKKYQTNLVENTPVFTLLPVGESVQSSGDPLASLTDFYYYYTRTYHLEQEQQTALKLIDKKQKGISQYVKKTRARLDEILHSSRHEEIANILMANLHVIKQGDVKAKLFDFYRNEEIEVKLKPGQTPQKQAEGLYRKAKNQKLEIAKLEENLAYKEGQLEGLVEMQMEIEAVSSVKKLRKYLADKGLMSEHEEQVEQLPYRKFEYNGYDILVGKNGKSNDILTQRYAHKEDLWLHARDVPGSHVVIKNKAGKQIPVPVIERAAALAAWYSKRKTESLCPVIVTPKKFVRKRKGAAPGEVVVDKEDVVMIEPASPSSL